MFKAWIEPEQLVRWFGPVGTAVPASGVRIDPRPGGVFDVVMVDDQDGTEYPSRGHYVELVEPQRLSFTESEIGMTTTVTFTDLRGKTEVVVHQTNVPEAYLGPEAEAAGRARSTGWASTWRRRADRHHTASAASHRIH